MLAQLDRFEDVVVDKTYVLVSLTELLKSETSMPDKLYPNSFACMDLKRSVSVFKRRPMLVLDQVPDKTCVVLLLVLPLRRDPCHLYDVLFSTRGDVD